MRNPMDATKATIPTNVEKWHALASSFMTQTSLFFCWQTNRKVGKDCLGLGDDEETYLKKEPSRRRDAAKNDDGEELETGLVKL